MNILTFGKKTSPVWGKLDDARPIEYISNFEMAEILLIRR